MIKSNTSQNRGIIISAPSSRAGKTTVALGLMRALHRRGYVVQPFKSGPDYIDTAFHKVAAGRPSTILDAWAMRKPTLAALITQATDNADISITEGAMGLFDGAPCKGQFATGTTADLAALTGWPVLLVIDVARQAATAAAIVKGCNEYRDDVAICGVVLNNVASARHERLVAPAIEALGIPVLASIPRRNDLSLPERHLGLKQAMEHEKLTQTLDVFADLFIEGGGIEKITNLAKPAQVQVKALGSQNNDSPEQVPPPGQRIALAVDEAFSFFYAHISGSWRAQGAQILPFSPLKDEPPSSDADAVWLPGGYPELHAEKLAAANKFKAGIQSLAAGNIPIHGECGGYMVLGQGLIDKNGSRHEMLGLLGLETSFAQRKLNLGYRKSTLKSDCSLGASGKTVFGHEFHYATVLTNDDPALADIFDANGTRVENCGSKRSNVTGTFFHLIDNGNANE